MYLKDILAISSAEVFKIKNLDTGKIIWNDSKTADGYETMLEEYGCYYVVNIQATGKARGYSVKSTLAINIQLAFPM